ncbi:MAG TPA: hypothetical protein VGK13_05650, partial [Methanocellaceae archaeon]
MAIIIVLVLVLAACALFVYNSLYPHTAIANPVTVTPTPTPVSPTATPRPTAHPTYASSSPTPQATPYVDIPIDTRVSITAGVYSNLGIWDHYIVYDETADDGSQKVHLYNTDNKQDHVIAQGNVHSYGTIGNGQVGLLFPNNEIKLYNIATGQTILVSKSNNAPRGSMVISGNYLLYSEDDGMTDPITKSWTSVYCVYLLDMHDYTTSSIASNIGKPIDIRMDGTYVVWTTVDGSGSGSDISLYNIQGKPLKVITIAQDGNNNNHARIS